jgi:hypothetical protein
VKIPSKHTRIGTVENRWKSCALHRKTKRPRRPCRSVSRRLGQTPPPCHSEERLVAAKAREATRNLSFSWRLAQRDSLRRMKHECDKSGFTTEGTKSAEKPIMHKIEMGLGTEAEVHEPRLFREPLGFFFYDNFELGVDAVDQPDGDEGFAKNFDRLVEGDAALVDLEALRGEPLR